MPECSRAPVKGIAVLAGGVLTGSKEGGPGEPRSGT